MGREGASVVTGTAIALVLLLGSCGDGGRPPEAAPGLVTTAPGRRTGASLPGTGGFGQGPHAGPCYARPGPGAPIAWLPPDLPFPEGTYAVSELQDDARFRRAVLAVPLTYLDFMQFALARWPDEGWLLGRGESETGEAEDSFIRGDTYGAMRARRVYCEDGWSEILLALGRAPALATSTTAASSG